MLSSLVALALAPLTPVEKSQLTEGLAVEQMCLGYIAEGSRRYLRELKLEVTRKNPELNAWFLGFNIGIDEEQIKNNYYPTLKECKIMLPKAFQQTELLKKLGK